MHSPLIWWFLGLCEAGYYCPEGSVYARQNPCGHAKFICPAGSSAPQEVTQGYYSVGNEMELVCPSGYYCKDGLRLSCPAGTYNPVNQSSALEECLPTPPGFYSGIASVAPTRCGGVDVYCPQGSSEPIPVSANHFTTAAQATVLSSAKDCSESRPNCTVVGALFYLESPNLVGYEGERSGEALCPKGHYCINGNRYECPPGTYGAEQGLQVAECSGKCWKGHYCPPASISPNERACNPLGNESNFCPEGSGYPMKAAAGYYLSSEPPFPSIGFPNPDEQVASWVELDSGIRVTSTAAVTAVIPLEEVYKIASSQVVCPPGSYCQEGRKHKCPAGTYGAHPGESSPFCR